MAEQRFNASPDRVVRIVSPVFWAGMLLGAAVVLTVPDVPLPVRVIFPCLMLVVPLATRAWAPRGYRIADGRFFVERGIGAIALPLSAIIEARRVQQQDFGWLVRLFGSGGVHGYYGRYRASTLGALDFQATRRDTLVLLRRGDGRRPLVLSPDDPDALVAALAATGAVPAASAALS